MGLEPVNLHRIYSETSNRIDALSRRVQEGRDVMAASEFCRWLLFSGIFKLLEENASPAPLKVDGVHLRWKCEQLLDLCNGRLRSNSSEPCLTAGYLQSLHDKVDLMAGYLSRLSAPSPVIQESNDGFEHGNGLPARSAGRPYS